MKKSELKDYNRLLREELKRTIKQKNKAKIELTCLEIKSAIAPTISEGEIKLLMEENNELVKDLNDLQADWAADHAEHRKTKPQLDPDFIHEDFAVTFNSELEYWSFMELCWGANLEWAVTGDPRKSRPKDFVLMAYAVSCMGSHLKCALLNHYERELGYKIIKASDYLGVYQ